MLPTKALKKLLQERRRTMENENKRKRERKTNFPKPSLTNFGKICFKKFLYNCLKIVETWNIVSPKYLWMKGFF